MTGLGPVSADDPALDAAVEAAGVHVTAATVHGEDGTVLPALVFRFAGDDGSEVVSPVCLTLDSEDMRDVAQLVTDAVGCALAALAQELAS